MKMTIKRVASVLVVFVLSLSLFVVPAMALSYTGTADISFHTRNANGSGSATYSGNLPWSGRSCPGGSSARYLNFGYFQLMDQLFDSQAVVYLSFFPYCTSTDTAVDVVGNPYDPALYSATYQTDMGETGDILGSGITIDKFTPVSSYSVADGMTLTVTFLGSEEKPISDFDIHMDSYQNDYFRTYASTSGFMITSARVIATDDAKVLAELEEIAAMIAEQNTILQGMYGDIVAVLNSIYNQTGDIQTTLNLANQYFLQMVNLLESIEFNTSEIYTLLSIKMDSLIMSIEQGFQSVQEAISRQTNDLIRYFDSVGDQAVGDLVQDTENAQDDFDNVGQIEGEYSGSVTDSYQELAADFNGFDGSVAGGVVLAGQLFSRVWSSLGDYAIIYSFPLLLGVTLVLVGRISRVDYGNRQRENAKASRKGGGG